MMMAMVLLGALTPCFALDFIMVHHCGFNQNIRYLISANLNTRSFVHLMRPPVCWKLKRASKQQADNLR